MSTLIQVINSGSSSIKYQLIDLADPGAPIVWATGLVAAIGEPGSTLTHHTRIGGTPTSPMRTVQGMADIPDHEAGFAAIQVAFDDSGPVAEVGRLVAFGHRVVHGGDFFSAPAVVDGEVLAAITACIPLAPLHNPANLAGITGAMAVHPDVPNVAVFDTAFHQTMPPRAFTYALDRDVAAQHRIRRYGFHGTSHAYVSRRATRLLDLDPEAARIISLHLGNGASACAVLGGRSVDTSMGMTPLAGLVMGTRSGDLDPAIPLHLVSAGMSAEGVDDLLNKQSGMRGLTGANDLREVHALAEAGDLEAELALEVYAKRIRDYLGAYAVTLGGIDAIVFTGGVGEHDVDMRQRVAGGLEWLGIQLDPTANAAVDGEAVISTETSHTSLLVVPTDEEGEIARQTLAALGF